MRKSNGVICSADVDFHLHEMDNPYDENDDSNYNLDDDKNRVYLNRRMLNFKGKGRELNISNPY